MGHGLFPFTVEPGFLQDNLSISIALPSPGPWNIIFLQDIEQRNRVSFRSQQDSTSQPQYEPH